MCAALAVAGLVSVQAPPAAAAANCYGGVLYVIAHTDDDLIFISPDLLHDLQSGRCVRAVFTTAGEAGEGPSYWGSLERGIRSSYAMMAGVPNTWTQSDAGVTGRSIPIYTLAGASISVVFMRIPDGFSSGSGSAAYDYDSILKLWNGSDTARPVDDTATYTKAQFQNAINELVTDFQPTTIRTTDWTTDFTNPVDHSDHWATAQFVLQAHENYPLGHTLVGYETYAIDEYAVNVTGAALSDKIDAFVDFADYDHNLCNTAGQGCPDSPYDEWLKRQYTTASVHTGNVARGSGVTVTTSSAASGQGGARARDGYAHGAPIDSTKEWATTGGKAGSWIQYAFSPVREINGVMLFDRPNLTDRVTGGTLLFTHGDGTTSQVPVGSLPNNGAGLAVGFAPRTVTSVRFQVTSVSASTTNVGLSEFETYSNFPTPPDATPPVVTVSPTSGEYPTGQQITLSANETADIYYTTNGTTPTTASAKYAGTITLNAAMTLTYIGVDTAGNTSAPASQTYTLDTTPPVVTVTPEAGEFSSGQLITLAANETADIYYTTDGNEPSAASTKYAGPITLTTAFTLKYTARDTAGNDSTVGTQSYTVAPIDTTAPVVTPEPPGGEYPAGTQIALGTDDPNGTIYFTTNGGPPTTSSTKYEGPITLTTAFTLKYIGVDAAGNLSEVGSQAYTVRDTTPPVVTANPVGGTYISGQRVTLTANETAEIFYTVDGNAPTTASAKYSGALTLTSSFTLRYFGRDTAGNESTLASQSYTVATAASSLHDLNGDTRADVLARDSGGRLWLYPGNGSGGWLGQTQIGSTWSSISAIAIPGDFNGDGRTDVIACDTNGRLWLYPGNGTGGLGARAQIGTGWGGMNAIFSPGDFNGDGKADVLARDTNGRLWLYPGNGTGGWLSQSQIGTGWGGMLLA